MPIQRGIRYRLTALMVAVLLVTIVTVSVESWNQQRHLNQLNELRDESLTRLRLIKSISDAYGQEIVNTVFRVRNYLISSRQGVYVINASTQTIEKDWAKLVEITSTKGQRQILNELTTARIAADQLIEKLRMIFIDKEFAALGRLADTELYPAIDPVTIRLKALVLLEQQRAERLIAEETTRVRAVSALRIIIFGALVVMFLVMARTIIRNISLGVESLTALTGKIGQGDFAYEPPRKPRGELGQIMRTLLTMRDDIASAQTELAQQLEYNEQIRVSLQRNEAQLWSFVEAAQVAVMAIDLQGISISFNPFAEKLTGYKAAEVIGKPMPMLFHVADEVIAAAAELAEQIGRPVKPNFDYFSEYTRRGGRPREWTFRRRDGSTVSVLLATSITRDDAGNPTGFLGIATDLTQIKELEKRLRISEAAAREASHAKSSFLATMSHEIRTPMIGVTGMIEVLSHTPLNADQQSIIGVIQQSAEALLQIIGDILDFSKIEAGQLSLSPIPADLRAVVKNTVANYDGAASGKGLVLACQIDQRLHGAYLVDPLRIRQILSNFLSNAIKFTDRGVVEVTLECLRSSIASDTVLLSVTDSGIGMTPVQQKKLFEPFTQADDSTTRRFGGSGLGLSICRRLADMMNAAITVNSQEGIGTTIEFRLELPRADPALIEQDSKNAAANSQFKSRQVPRIEHAIADHRLILIVDDHPTNRQVIARQLALAGFAMESADGGREAFERWQSGRYGLVLTDIHMPDIDGYALTREIRGAEAARKLPRTSIIALTAATMKGDAERCLAAGMDDFLPKPVSVPQLQICLDRWLPPASQSAASQVISQDLSPVAASMPVSSIVTTDLPNATAIIDTSVLRELAGNELNEQKSLLADFLNTCYSDIDELQRAIDARDSENIARQAHRIKGAARLVGAKAVAQVAAQLEIAAKANGQAIDIQSLRAQVDRLAQYTNEINA